MRRNLPRLKAQKALRCRDRAAAFDELQKVENHLKKIKLRLDETRQKMASIATVLNSKPIIGGISASQLQMESLNSERLNEELDGLTELEKLLDKQLSKAAIQLDITRDAAAKAHRAVTILDDEDR